MNIKHKSLLLAAIQLIVLSFFFFGSWIHADVWIASGNISFVKMMTASRDIAKILDSNDTVHVISFCCWILAIGVSAGSFATLVSLYKGYVNEEESSIVGFVCAVIADALFILIFSIAVGGDEYASSVLGIGAGVWLSLAGSVAGILIYHKVDGYSTGSPIWHSHTGAATFTGYCPQCGAALQDDAKFCTLCGAPTALQRCCNNCGKELTPEVVFCPDCGTKAEPLASAAPSQSYGKPWTCSYCGTLNYGGIHCKKCNRTEL